MLSKCALLINLLLASVALAVPSSRPEAHPARHSRPLNRLDSRVSSESNMQYGFNWAGAVWDGANGTFTTVSGTFTVPTPSGNGHCAACAWVGIDGHGCGSAILQAGVDFTVADDGEVSYDGWYEWFPDISYGFTGFNISAGDVVKTTVTAYSTTSGEAVMENLTTNQTVSKRMASNFSLCMASAEWIVEDFEEGSGFVPFADFGTVVFNNATAPGTDGIIYTPSGANFIGIEQNGTILTSVSADGSTLTVSYI